MQAGALPSSSTSNGPVDLSNCDREPIHTPGAIQPHGVLLAITEEDLRTVTASANIAVLAGLPVEEAVGNLLSQILDEVSFGKIEQALHQPDLAMANPIPIIFRRAGPASFYDGILHRHGGLTFLELEPRGENRGDMHEFFHSTSGTIKRLQGAADLGGACTAAAQEVRRLTGFDRVKVYRFASDHSGEVIAEDRCDDIDSFLGLHFPPSDIPTQARALYAANPIRIIPDIHYEPSPLVPDRNPVTGGPIDLSFSLLRSVSPVHLEYMNNMGIAATMSVSILRGGELWGLIACHNRKPRHVGYQARQACEMVAQFLSWQIGLLEEAEVSRQSLKGKSIQRRLLDDIGQIRDHRAGLMRNGEELLALMSASGLALYGSDGITTVGRSPPVGEIERLVDWLASSEVFDLFETNGLSTLYPAAAAYMEVASGVLAIPLSRSPKRLMLWFRPEIAQTVTWGGNPHKPVSLDPNGERLQPRKSFQAWSEEVRGRSRPWAKHEIAAAIEIRDLVIEVILRKAEELERVNVQLTRSNEELESFAYVASHDLKEPLRHIEAFAGLLNDWIKSEGNERLASMVAGIETSSRRLQHLINDLAEFSRVGRQAQPMAPASLEEIVRESLLDLNQNIMESGATVLVESLPTIVCDRNQMRQMLQNLLSNAIKYRHPRRPPVIRVYEQAKPRPAHPEDRTDLWEPEVRICVQDNGIGFDEKYADQVFEPFQRLHSPDEYEGSGIGLAICRKIVQRHGGTIGVVTTPGLGSTFWFTLPMHAARKRD